MRVAVTGGSGVVGTAVLRHLVESGHDLRVLGRSEAASEKLRLLGVDVTPGDLLDFPSMLGLTAGVDWVFHIGGINELCPADPQRMWKVNVEGTRLVVEACKQNGVSRLIHTSSAAAIGESSGEVGTEQTTHRGSYLSHYERSKTEAERLVLASAGDLDVVVVNPSSVQGPGRATGSGRLLLDATRGRLPFVFDTTFSLVDIDDCARGHLLAAERGQRGQRYLLSGATLNVRQMVSLLKTMVGTPITPRYLKPGILSGLSQVVAGAYRAIGRQGPICPEMVAVMRHGHRFEGSRATRDLGLEYTPVEETLERTVAWFEAQGFI